MATRSTQLNRAKRGEKRGEASRQRVTSRAAFVVKNLSGFCAESTLQSELNFAVTASLREASFRMSVRNHNGETTRRSQFQDGPTIPESGDAINESCREVTSWTQRRS
ncbi:MAG: hypothetical protein QF805_24015, partial [Pirellulaceae bacterium]|jgi:hypothetical protein|nr:hypothetical protein [Pirellulaceae bacterium]